MDDGRTLPPGVPANDDRPVFNMGSDFVVDEAAGTITFTVTKSGATDLASSVNFNTVDGSAVAGEDYAAASGTLNFAAGETVKTVTVAITNDAIFEGAQDFSVQLSAPSNATLGDNTQVATIVDDGRTLPGGPANDDRPSLSIGSDVIIDEAAGTVTFTVTKTGATEQPVSVDFATANGSATAGADYTGQSGTLSFAAGETVKTITIAITNDTQYEISEDFSVSISNPVNAVLGTSSATGTIVDDGRSLPGGGTANDDRPGFSINDLTIDEAAGTVTFTVTRTGDLTQSAAVDYAGQDNTATGADYSVAAGTLNFAAGVASQTITVAITNDGTFEGAEQFNLNLANPVGAVIVDGQGVGTIVDDGRTLPPGVPANDDRPTLSIDSPTVSEGGYATFTATLSNASTTAVTFTPSLTGGTATLGTDTSAANTLEYYNGTAWVSATGGVSIPAGSTSVQLRLQTTDDLLDEPAENFSLTGTVTSGNTANALATGTASITDNDPTPSFSINDITVNEAAGTATFTVSLSAASGQATSVNWGLSNGTALSGSDYTMGSGTLNFAAGITSQTITVSILNDTPRVYEGSETFNVNLSAAVNATIADNLGVGTIIDNGTGGGGSDDDRPTLSIDSPTVSEGGYATFTATLSNASTTAVTFTPSLTGGTATLGTDTSAASTLEYYNGTAWVSATGGVSIPAGSTSVQLRLQTTDDLLDEPAENFSLTGTVTSGNTANALATGTASITDNDPTPSFSINDITVNEAAGTATFTVSLSAASGQATSVNWGLSNGTALAGSDYTNNSGTLNFAPGVTTQTITVAILNDSPLVYEGSETFNVNLSAAVNATIADNLGVGTIMDNGTGGGGSDDDRPTLSIDSPTVTEGGYATFTATLSNASTTAVTFTPSLTGGMATLGTDTSAASTLQYYNGTAWVSATGGVTIPAGSTSVQLRLQTTDDLLDEPAENFSLTGTVTSGNTANASATGTASITDNDTTPTVGTAGAVLSEEGLTGGIADTTGNTDTTDVRTITGTIPVADADGNALTVTLTAPLTALTSNGQPVTWSGTGTQMLIGSAGGNEVIRVSVDNAGNYTATLSKAVDHPLNSQEDVLSFNVGVTASDSAQSGTGTLTISIEDDMPTAIPGTQTVVLPSQDTNIMLILDVSGSMSDDADGVAGGPTRLDVMKSSVNMMLDQYDNLGDIKVRIVTFSSNAAERDAVWVDVTRAKQIVNGLTANGSTNYDAALVTAQGAFTDSGKIVGAKNVSYFLTDGQPTAASDWDGSGPLTSQNGIQSGEETLWVNFLTANQINSMAYGMGTGATQVNMNPVAYDGINQVNTNAIVVANPAVDLPPILRDSIVMPTVGELVNGSLGAGSGIGADGGVLAAFVLNGTTYSSGGAVSGTNRGTYDAATNSWTVTSTAGGKFAVDMDNSQYTYTPPASTSTQYSESIAYTLRDNDGDSASSVLTIDVMPPQVVTLTSTNASITGLNMGLSGEYFGYNEYRDGTASDPAYEGSTTVRLHSDDGTADAGSANNVDRLADVEAIIEGRNNNTNLINNAILSDPTKADATFSVNKLEFGLPAGSNTPLFSNDLGQNGKVTSGTIGTTAGGNTNNLYTFLKVSSGNVDGLAATSGLGDTTDAVIRMVGYIYIPAGGVYDMRVTADDGYRVLINGQNLGQADFIQSTATQVYSGVTLSEGLQPIEILYWDQAGHASLRVELKASGAADSTYKIIGNDEYALFSPSDVPALGANEDIVESTTNGVWQIREGETYNGTNIPEKIVGSDGKDTIHAGGGNDIVQGGSGSDLISGGAGDDVLSGGLGSDTFAWTLADQGSVGLPAKDIIADFNLASKAAGGDVLDLRDLLPTATTGAALDAYLNFSTSGSDTVIDVKPDGANVTQQIVLAGVDLGATGANDVTIINDLLTKGKLITD
ncbi:Calx-beta domain-containing protein [Dechloromonas sp.]|uniref:Calx-beta domain-containing protein n=1 Tax=Dechloromonas sp. TaxID=1917218 RepID=UPI00286DFC05|nr:Calx-beta domain-containing protein [Dechloromonas sp.]